jgi:hypothetical protein
MKGFIKELKKLQQAGKKLVDEKRNESSVDFYDILVDDFNTFTSKLKRRFPSLALSKEIRDRAKKHIEDVVTRVHGFKYRVGLDRESAGLLKRLALKRTQAEEALKSLKNYPAGVKWEQWEAYEYYEDYCERVIRVSDDRMAALVTYGKKVRKSYKEIKGAVRVNPIVVKKWDV